MMCLDVLVQRVCQKQRAGQNPEMFIELKILTKLNIKWHMYIPPEHLNFFSKIFLDSYLNHLGFKLIKRYYSSGGLINPFRGIPLISAIFNKFMFYYDKSFLNKLPIFDHLFSYYKKIAQRFNHNIFFNIFNTF